MLSPLTQEQRDQLSQYAEQLAHFNTKINLISPNTVDEIWTRHIEHSLALTLRRFPSGARVVDWGTGGGLPVVPMAICFPDVQFTGVDAVGKKMQAVRAMVRRLGLDNLDVWHGRADSWDGKANYSISRATAPLQTLWQWHQRVYEPFPASDEDWTPGLVCLKGGDLLAGDLLDECNQLKAAYPNVKIFDQPVDTVIPSPLFSSKYILHIH